MMNHNPNNNNNLDSLTGMMVDDGSGGGSQLAQSVPSGTVDGASANTSNIQLLIGLNGTVSGYHHPHQQHQVYHNQPISIVSSSSVSTTNNSNDPNNTMDPNQGYTLYQVQYSGGNQLDSYEPVHWNNKNQGQQQMTYENQADNSGLAQHHLILQPSGHQLAPQQQQILVQQQSPDSQQLIWTTHHPNQNYHVTAVNSSNGLSLQTQQSSEMYLTNNGSSLVSLDPTSFGSQIIQQQYNPQSVTTTSSSSSSSGNDPSLSSPSATTSSSSATTSTVPVPSAKPAAPKRTTKRGQKNNGQGGEPGVRAAKPVSAYALFFRDTQASVKAESPSATFGDVSKIVASKWEVLAKAEKDVYKERADQEKLNYLQNLASSKAKQVAGMQQTVDGAITSTSTNDPGSISQDNLTISSSTGSSVGFIQPSPSIQVHSQGDSSGQVSTTTATNNNNNNNNNQYQAQQVVVVDPSSSMLGLLGNSSVPAASSNGLVTGQQHHHHQMLSYQDPSSYHQSHHQLLHQHHHQSTLNPVMSQSSFEQYSMNSGQSMGVSNGSQQQQQGLMQHHLGHHQDALSLIGDNSFFNSVDSSSTSNLIDSLGIDLTDLDDKLDSLLSSGGILSPGTSSVFDTALDAQDYLMNELNGMTDTTVHHHQDQNGPSHEQHDLYSSLTSIQPDSSQLTAQEEEVVSVELLPAVPESSQQSTEDDSQEQQQQQEDNSVGHSYKDVEQYQQPPNSLPQDESPVEAVEPAPSCPPPARCIRSGCDQLSVSSPQWDNEFCSEQCCVKYCSQIFQQWTSRPDKPTSSQADTLPSTTTTTASELTSLGPAGTSLPLPTSYIAS